MTKKLTAHEKRLKALEKGDENQLFNALLGMNETDELYHKLIDKMYNIGSSKLYNVYSKNPTRTKEFITFCAKIGNISNILNVFSNKLWQKAGDCEEEWILDFVYTNAKKLGFYILAYASTYHVAVDREKLFSLWMETNPTIGSVLHVLHNREVFTSFDLTSFTERVLQFGDATDSFRLLMILEQFPKEIDRTKLEQKYLTFEKYSEEESQKRLKDLALKISKGSYHPMALFL